VEDRLDSNPSELQPDFYSHDPSAPSGHRPDPSQMLLEPMPLMQLPGDRWQGRRANGMTTRHSATPSERSVWTANAHESPMVTDRTDLHSLGFASPCSCGVPNGSRWDCHKTPAIDSIDDLTAAWDELEQARHGLYLRERDIAQREAAVHRAKARNIAAARQLNEHRHRLDEYGEELEEGMFALTVQQNALRQERRQTFDAQPRARRVYAVPAHERGPPEFRSDWDVLSNSTFSTSSWGSGQRRSWML